MLEKLKSGFKRTINWNIYQSKVPIEQQNQYLDFLIDPSFEVNRLFVLLFENKDDRIAQTGFYLKLIEKVNSYFIDNIWGVDLADIQLISKFNKGFTLLLCVLDIYSIYA